MRLIDNKEIFAKDALNNIAQSHTEEIDILVGYFSLDGFWHIAESLRHKRVRILVGLKFKYNRQYQELLKQLLSAVNKQSSLWPLKSIKNATLKEQEAWQMLSKKLVDGSLRIRKAPLNDHSKFYLFHPTPRSKYYPHSIVIMGSSNLTHSGLTGQNESNICLSNGESLPFVNKFNRLWKNARSMSLRDFSVNSARSKSIGHQAKIEYMQPSQQASRQVVETKPAKPLAPTISPPASHDYQASAAKRRFDWTAWRRRHFGGKLAVKGSKTGR